MKRLLTAALAALLAASVASAKVLPPPANQYLGIPDTIFNNMTEATCRTCHNQNPPAGVPVDSTYLPTRHHLLVAPAGKPPVIIPNPTDAPCAVAGWPLACTPGTSAYQCLSCHKENYDPLTDTFTLDPNFRNCMVCHKQTAGGLTVHHRTTLAQTGKCADCHGDFVANLDGGQPAPTYIPSIVTPWPSKKPNGDNTVPANSAGIFAGNCNYCHNTANGDIVGTIDNTGPFAPVTVYRNDQTHHNTGFFSDPTKCAWCHNAGGPPNSLSIRTCERCHDIRSLHNIEYSTVKGFTPGTLAAGYGHIGAQWDCWGCHGNNGVPIGGAADLGPAPTSAIVPGLDATSFLTKFAGAALPLNLKGASFANQAVINGVTYNYEAIARLVDKAGVVTELTGAVTGTDLAVTLPATLAPGAYNVQAKKGTYKKSNVLVFALKPKMTVTSATYSSTPRTTTIKGTNFGAYQGKLTNPSNKACSAASTKVTTVYNGKTLTGKVSAWSDTSITVQFKNGSSIIKPTRVTVINVYDTVANYTVR